MQRIRCAAEPTPSRLRPRCGRAACLPSLSPLFAAALLPAEAAPAMHCVAQDKRLPLHYATERGATLEEVVVKLLLGPEGSGKATAIATDKARALPTPPLALPLHLGPTHVLPVLSPRRPCCWVPWPRLRRVRLATCRRRTRRSLMKQRTPLHAHTLPHAAVRPTEAVHCEPPCRTRRCRCTTPP